MAEDQVGSVDLLGGNGRAVSVGCAVELVQWAKEHD